MQKSIHLESFPSIEGLQYDLTLVDEIEKIRHICSTALSIRKENNIRVRLPLNKMSIFGKDVDFIEKYKNIILDEINVKELELSNDIQSVGNEIIQINFKTLGPKIGKNIQKVIQGQKNNKYTKLDNGNIEIDGIVVEKKDFEISFKSYDAQGVQFCNKVSVAVILDINVTENLVQEGIMRDFTRIVQQDRKANDYNVMDKIIISISCNDDEILHSINKHKDYILHQCLADDINILQDDEIEDFKTHEILSKLIKVFLYKNV